MRHLGATISRRFWIDVAVEEGLRGGNSAGPEAGAAHFVAIGFAGDAVRQAGQSSRVRRGLSPREAADRKIEASPPEVHRTRLAAEAGTEVCEYRQHRRQGRAEPLSGVSIIFSRGIVLSEGTC